MKKILILMFAASIFSACNSNPQETGDEIIMKQERKENALEHQKNPITTVPDSVTMPIDSAMTKDTTTRK